MTKPTISYGHGYLFDCDVAYTTHVQTPIGNGHSLSVIDNDYFDIVSGGQGNTDRNVYYQSADLTSFAISTSVHPKVLVRWKTELSSGGIGARAQLVYVEGPDETQELLGVTPQYSTTWKVTTTTLTANRTLKYIRFWADDYPDAQPYGVSQGHAYFDFILICKGVFTFPFVSGDVDLDLSPRNSRIEVPERVGDVTQNMGSKSLPIVISGEMDSETDWQGVNNKIGEVLYDISHNSYREPWQWFTSDLGSFKVTLDEPTHLRQQFGVNSQRTYIATFTEKRQSCGSNENYYERFGLF